LWLSALVDAMDKVSGPKSRAAPIDPLMLVALGAQLARPASPYPYGASHLSLRNQGVHDPEKACPRLDPGVEPVLPRTKAKRLLGDRARSKR
jgi:hypothetical protein